MVKNLLVFNLSALSIKILFYKFYHKERINNKLLF